MKIVTAIVRSRGRRSVAGIGWALFAVSLAGCAVPVHQQRLVSRPSMQFSDAAASSYHSKVLSQIETGAAASGGAQAAGCTSCR